MTATKSEDTPDEWSEWDDIAVEVYSHLDLIERIGDFNALVFFTDKLFLDEIAEKVHIDENDAEILHDFLDQAVEVDTIIQKYFGKNYIAEYIETIETEGPQ